MYSFRNNWQSCDLKKKKKGGKSQITISSLRAGAACCGGSEHLAGAGSAKQQLHHGCLSSIRDMGTWGEINRVIKHRRGTERSSVSPSASTTWASLIAWLNYRLLQPWKCAKSFGTISLWEEINKTLLTDKATSNYSKGWMKNWNSVL